MIDAARQMDDVTGLSHAYLELSSSLGGLFAVAENYPALKADQTFINLQQRITGLENQIADRREFYNDSVNNNNVRIKQFPDVIVAGLFNFERAEMLKFSRAELEDVDVSARFKS